MKTLSEYLVEAELRTTKRRKIKEVAKTASAERLKLLVTRLIKEGRSPADISSLTAVPSRAIKTWAKEAGLTVLEGYKVLPPIDTERYQEREGLEGPFRTRSGKVVYYDPREGKYYDPDTDMYLSYDEWYAYDKDEDVSKTTEAASGGGPWVIYNTATKKLAARKRWSTYNGVKAALAKANNPDYEIASELFYIDNIKPKIASESADNSYSAGVHEATAAIAGPYTEDQLEQFYNNAGYTEGVMSDVVLIEYAGFRSGSHVYYVVLDDPAVNNQNSFYVSRASVTLTRSGSIGFEFDPVPEKEDLSLQTATTMAKNMAKVANNRNVSESVKLSESPNSFGWSTKKSGDGFEWKVYAVEYGKPNKTLESGREPTRARAVTKAKKAVMKYRKQLNVAESMNSVRRVINDDVEAKIDDVDEVTDDVFGDVYVDGKPVSEFVLKSADKTTKAFGKVFDSFAQMLSYAEDKFSGVVETRCR